MREIFSLVGRITTEGFQKLNKDLSAIDKSVASTAKQIGRFGTNVTRLGTNITKLTAPLAAAGAGIMVLATKTADYADQLLDLKDITGLSTDTLQELEQVAREAGVDFQGLTGTISAFQRHLPEIVKGNGAASDAMRALGVNALDAKGNIRDMNDLFPEMIQRLQGMDNVAERNAIASQLFGKSMKDLAPVLGMSAAQFNKVRAEAHSMGMVMSEESLEAANKFKVSLEKLKGQFVALGRNLAMQFIPILQDTILPMIQNQLIPMLKKWGERIGAVATWFSKLSPEVKDFAVKTALVLVTMGPFLILLGKAIGMIRVAATVFRLLTSVMLMNPFGLIVTSIGVLVTAGILLYKNWDFVVDKLGDAWEWITHMYQQGIGYIRAAVFSAISGMLGMVKSVVGWVPGLGNALDGLQAQMDALATAEVALVIERRAARAESELEKKTTAELTAVVKAAEDATNDYKAATLAEIAAREADAKAAEKQKQKEKELAEARTDFEGGWTDKLRQATLSRGALLEYEYQQALSKAEELGASRQSIEEYYEVERLKLSQEEAEKKADLAQKELDDRKEKAKETVGVITDAINQMFALGSMSTDNELARLDQETEAKKAAVNASVMSEEEKALKKEQIDKGADKKRRELQREQAKRDKAAAVFGAVINGVQAVSKALTLGFPLGLVMAVIFGLLAAAQVAMIVAEPLPALAKGGVVKKSQGGTQVIAGEGQEDEMILPMRTGVRKVVGDVIEGVRSALGGQELPGGLGGGGMGGMALAGAGGGGMHLHVHGTLITDESGMRNLERTLLRFRNQESQRKGE